MTQEEVIERSIIAHSPLKAMAEAAVVRSTVMQSIQQNLAKIRKTLVLDLDETLVHSGFQKPDTYDLEVPVTYQNQEYKIYVQKRPGFDAFMQRVIRDFDVYIFTASMPEYAIPVVQALMPFFPASRILTRYHCRFIEGCLVKDLTIFNRDLSSMIIIDNSPLCYQLQKENGIEVTTWTGDEMDSELEDEVLPLLQDLKNVDDVRKIITTL